MNSRHGINVSQNLHIKKSAGDEKRIITDSEWDAQGALGKKKKKTRWTKKGPNNYILKKKGNTEKEEKVSS